MDGGAFDTSLLASAIATGAPTGIDLRSDPAHRELYYRLKDARSAARSAERAVAPGEPMRLAPAWIEVRELARTALTTLTKDIEILAWLAEAELRINRFRGLAEVFDAAALLVDEAFDELHSIDGDGIEDKVAPFAGLNGIGGEGTLIQPIRLTPLVPGAPFFESSLWHYQVGQRPGAGGGTALEAAMAEAGPQAMREHCASLDECRRAFAALSAALDRRCRSQAPPSSNTRSVLDEARDALVHLARLPDAGAGSVEEDAPAATGGATAPKPVAPAARAGEIASREDAFQRLLEIAAYFRRAEPHSPLSSSIETLVARGRMDFLRLLEELLPDQHLRQSVLSSAGIRLQGDERQQ